MNTRALRVVIVGGGIGGVAAANALLQRGIDVHVYEQAPQLAEVGAGLALASNGIRMMRRLGLGAAIAQWGARWTDPQFRHADGTYIAPMWPPGLEDKVEYFGMHRADLLDILVRNLPNGIVHTGHQCIGFDQDDDRAVVSFSNGERVTADVVIGADGIHSTLQGYVVAPSAPLSSGSIAYRGVVPSESVSWPSGRACNWVGMGKHFLVYPVRAGQLLNYVGFVPTDEQMKESWSAPGDPAALAREFAGWDPVVEAITAQVDTTFRWGLYDRESLPRWTRGRLTLLGDAAHPMLPHAGQGANQAIEDGVALATILANVDRAAVPAALLTYESIRRERTTGVQRIARLSGARYDSRVSDLEVRDKELSAQAQERAWIWDYDAEAAAAAATG